MRGLHQDDLLELVGRIVAATEEAGEKTVTVKIVMLRRLLDLAKLAPKPRGRPPLKGRDRVQEAVSLQLARSHKKKLIAEGMPKEVAHEKAAEDTAEKLSSRNLAISTIKRRME